MALLAAFGATRGRSAEAGASGFTIMALGSFSGAKASQGLDALDGVNLALKDAGFRLANLEVRLDVDDDKGIPGAALELAKRKAGIDPIDVVLTALTPSALTQVLPIFANANIFVLNLLPAPQTLAAENCSPWFFDLAGEEDGLHEAAGMMMNGDAIHRLVVLGPDRAATDHAVEALSRTFQGQILETIRTGEGSATFGKELGTIRHLSPDGVYSVLTGGMSVAFVHGWGESEPKGRPRLYAPWYGFERALLPAMGDAALGVNTVGTWAPETDGPINHRLMTGFESEFGRTPSTWSCHGFDAINLLDGVLKLGQGKPMDKETIRMALRHAELASPRGTLRFNTNHFPILSYWHRVVAHDGKGRLVNEAKGLLVRDWRGHSAACPMRWAELPPAAQAKTPAQLPKKKVQ